MWSLVGAVFARDKAGCGPKSYRVIDTQSLNLEESVKHVLELLRSRGAI